MSRSLWAAVALSFFIALSSVFASQEGMSTPAQSARKTQTKTSQTKKATIPSEQEIESGCEERFNPYRLKYSDTAEQDICTS
ncbi:MAG: hypothetical protein KA715_06110 [Xanthomonadaceae bacterium]|nr:hypothetical protein [Xanthomonadaceae bacterium]